MQDEYVLKNGINYRADGYAFCDRCGCNQIVNDRCLKCDVTPTEADQKLADGDQKPLLSDKHRENSRLLRRPSGEL